MKEALEQFGRFLPPNTQPAIMLEPRYRTLHRPAPTISAQASTILRRHATVRSVRRNQVHTLTCHCIVKFITVISFVANDAIRRDTGEHEVKQVLHQLTFMRLCRAGVNSNRQAAGINQHHDFHAFSGLCTTDAIATALGFAERSIDEALIKFVAAALFYAAPCFAHQTLENARAYPRLEPSMHRALGAEVSRQIFPFCAVVEYPEDTGDGIAFISWWPAAFGIPRRIRYAFTYPIQLFVRESHCHANLYCPTQHRFRDRF